MVKFKDSKGREWFIPKLSTPSINLLRDKFGMDLRGMIRKDSSEIALALCDDEKISNIVWHFNAADAEKQGIDKEEFLSAWDDATLTVGQEAIQEAFWLFSQGPKIAMSTMQKVRAARGTIPTSTSSDSVGSSPE